MNAPLDHSYIPEPWAETEQEPQPIPLIIIWVPLLIASWGVAAGVGYGLWMAARAVIG